MLVCRCGGHREIDEGVLLALGCRVAAKQQHRLQAASPRNEMHVGLGSCCSGRGKFIGFLSLFLLQVR